MAFSYCPHCGFKNMYSMQAPKFCGGCGESLSILSAAKTQKSISRKQVSPQRNQVVDDPDGVDIYEVPHISKLSYSIETDKNKFNLKDLVPLEAFEEFNENKEKSTAKKQATKKKRGRPAKR